MNKWESMRKAAEARKKAGAGQRTSAYPRGHRPGRPSALGERFTRRGEVMVTRSQYRLLRALRSQAEQAFPTRKAWARAAAALGGGAPVVALERCASRMPEIWVSRTRYGTRTLCALQARGRAIVDGEVPAWFVGHGRFGTGPEAGGARPVGAPVARLDSVRAGRLSDLAGRRPSHDSDPRDPLRALGIGQLIERIDYAQSHIEDAGPDGEVATRRLIDAELALSTWGPVRGLLPDMGAQVGASIMLPQAAEEGDLEAFVLALVDVDATGLLDAAKRSLQFPFGWQKLLALEEVVLVGEARALGVGEASQRRRELRDQLRRALLDRVLDLAAPPEPDEGTPYWDTGAEEGA